MNSAQSVSLFRVVWGKPPSLKGPGDSVPPGATCLELGCFCGELGIVQP